MNGKKTKPTSLNFEERSKFKMNFNILRVELDDLTINFTWGLGWNQQPPAHHEG
jgi:hypothetical protein